MTGEQMNRDQDSVDDPEDAVSSDPVPDGARGRLSVDGAAALLIEQSDEDLREFFWPADG